jgi:hypothetical protein
MAKVPKSNSDKIFLDQIGQKATVERELAGPTESEAPNRKLFELGTDLKDIRHHLKNYRYMGSAAVHIYYNETLKQLDFISQTAPLEMQGCPEILAGKAFDDLLEAMRSMYGHKRRRLRSGF